MKKTLIALAVLGSIAGVAQAQSSVTIYGKLDSGVTKLTGTPTTMKSNHTSRLGFKGAEDLGGGLSAIFQIENRFQSDTGDMKGQLFEGQSIVGLTGGFGTVKLGRTGNVVDSVGSVQADPFGGDGMAGLAALTTARYSNTVTYFTPSMSGFGGQAQYVLGEDNPDFTAAEHNDGFGVAATYNNGPINLGAGYQEVVNTVDTNVWGLSGSYAFGPAKVLLGYDQKDTNVAGAPRTKHAVIGATYAIGAGLIKTAYGQTKDGSSKVLVTTGADYDKIQKLSIGYQHNLSKRTSLYADVARTKFSSATVDKSVNGVGVGVTHNF